MPSLSDARGYLLSDESLPRHSPQYVLWRQIPQQRWEALVDFDGEPLTGAQLRFDSQLSDHWTLPTHVGDALHMWALHNWARPGTVGDRDRDREERWIQRAEWALGQN